MKVIKKMSRKIWIILALSVLISIDLFALSHLRSGVSTFYQILIFPASVAFFMVLFARRSFVHFIVGISIVVISSVSSHYLFYYGDPKGLGVGMFVLLLRTIILSASYFLISALALLQRN